MTDLLVSDTRVWASTPTRTEIIAGIRPDELEPMRLLFGVMSWVDIDADIADAAGELARRYRTAHGEIGTVDYLIAAATQSIGASLVTLNERHFPMFPDPEPAYRWRVGFSTHWSHVREQVESCWAGGTDGTID